MPEDRGRSQWERDRTVPSLLDKLIDEAPRRRSEGSDMSHFTVRRLREAVRRDLSWLLNAVQLSAHEPLEAFPNVETSVLNFGMPALSGGTIADLDSVALERRLTRIIQTFEPRILRRTLRVRLLVDREEMSTSALVFVIEGDIWAEPQAERIRLRSEIDLETGSVRVADLDGGG